MKHLILSLILALPIVGATQDIVKKAPLIKEGDGPYTQLIIRGVMLIDGTGAPPVGPVSPVAPVVPVAPVTPFVPLVPAVPVGHKKVVANRRAANPDWNPRA